MNLTTNGFALLFDEIRYELFGFEIDNKVNNFGITTTMEYYASFKSNEVTKYKTAGWNYCKTCETHWRFYCIDTFKIISWFC